MREPDSTLREKREAIVREHMESENRHDFDATIETFGHPRYELIATDTIYDGEEVDRLVCERVYFDSGTILRQLTE